MKLRTKVLLGSSVPFLGFFVFGMTEFGQRYLQRGISPDTDHWKTENIVIGAEVGPWIFGLFPFLWIIGIELVFLFFDSRKKSK
jgi:hypothetical protein